jgi:hypothetical protein
MEANNTMSLPENVQRVCMVEGSKNLIFKEFIPVSSDSDFELSIKGKFRSAGNVLSKIYFGISCYTNNQDDSIIYSDRVYRKGNVVILENISTDGKTLTMSETAKGWNDDGPNYYRILGVYLDGDDSKLPDYILKSYEISEGKVLNMNPPLSEEQLSKMQIGVTKLSNHISTSTYMYSAASNLEIPNNAWQECSAIISTHNKMGENNLLKFRTGTNFVKLIILANYSQDNSAVLLFKDLEIVGSKKITGYQL